MMSLVPLAWCLPSWLLLPLELDCHCSEKPHGDTCAVPTHYTGCCRCLLHTSRGILLSTLASTQMRRSTQVFTDEGARGKAVHAEEQSLKSAPCTQQTQTFLWQAGAPLTHASRSCTKNGWGEQAVGRAMKRLQPVVPSGRRDASQVGRASEGSVLHSYTLHTHTRRSFNTGCSSDDLGRFAATNHQPGALSSKR